MTFGRNSGLRTGELLPLGNRSFPRAEEDLGVQDRKDTPAVTVSRYKNGNGREKILVCRSVSVDRSRLSTVMEIEKAIEELPALEFRALAAWLEVRKSGLAGELRRFKRKFSGG